MRVPAVTIVALLGVVLAACTPSAPAAPAPPAATAVPLPTAAPATPVAPAGVQPPPAKPAAAPGVAAQASAKLLRVGTTQDEGTLTPYTYVSGYPGWNMLNLVYDTLVFLDLDNNPGPGLATAFKGSDDAKIWSVTVRDGVKWHDGQPFSGEDVKFSFEFAAQHTHSRWTGPAKNIERIEVQGATVTFILKQPVPGFAVQPLGDMPIFPKHLWQGVTDPRAFDKSIGTGPYRLVERQPDQFYRFQANAEFFMGRPPVEELVMPVIKEPSTTFAALRGGELDATVRPVPPESIKEFAGQPEFQVASGPGFSSTLLQFNTERAPFDRRELRQAIDLLIDKQMLVDTLLLGLGTVGNPGYLHPALPLHDPSLKASFDPTRARALLDGLGFADTNGDGVREAAGRPMEYTILAGSSQPLRLRAAELIAAALKEAGIRLTVRPLDPTAVTALVWKNFDVTQPRDYDLSIFGWSPPVMIHPDALGRLVHSKPDRGPINIGGYRDPEADRLSDELAETVDPDRRKQIVRQQEAFIAREVPFVTLLYEDGAYAYRPRAYDGWVFQKGQGTFQKLSFLPR